MKGKQASVLAADDESLSETWSVCACREFPEREISHERLHSEMHHSLKHGDFDETALACSSPLDKGAGDAEPGVDACDRISESRANEAWLIGIDRDAEKAAHRLCNRIVDRSLRIRT